MSASEVAGVLSPAEKKTTHADYFYGDIPCVRSLTKDEVESAYELETGNVIVEGFANLNPIAVPGTLLHNHGPFSWGKDAMDAVHNITVLEYVANMAWHNFALNPNMKPMSQTILDKHYLRKHGANAYYGQ